MAKSKKISINMIAADNPHVNTSTVVFKGTDGDIELQVKYMLTSKECIKFVNDIVNICVNEDQDIYRPEMLDAVVRIYTLVYYANISMPTNLDKAFIAVYQTGIYRDVISAINLDQYNALGEAIEQRIEFAKQKMVATQASLLQELVSKMDAAMEENREALATFTSPDFKEQLDNAMRVVGTAHDYPDIAEVESEPLFGELENVTVLRREDT